MKHIILALTLLFAGAVHAQTAALTGTVTDSDGQTWNNATWTATLSNPAPAAKNVCSVPNTRVQQESGTLSSAGVFSGTLDRTDCIVPANEAWIITICSQTSATCQMLPQVQITSASYDAGTYVSGKITAPRFIATSGAYGYNDTEVESPVIIGASYLSSTVGAQRTWNGTQWITAAGAYPDKGSQLYNVMGYGAKCDSTTDDSTAFTAAIQACNQSTTGRGTILVPPGKTCNLITGDIDFTAGLTPGVGVVARCGIDNQGTLLLSTTSGAAVFFTPGRQSYTAHTITTDITSGADTLTLDTVAGLTVGDRIYYAYTQTPTNTAETENNGSATITNIAGNVITLDTTLSAAMTVASTPAANRWVELPVFHEDATLNFGYLKNANPGVTSFVGPYWGSFLRHLTITAHCYEPYSGCITTQYAEGIEIPSVVVDSATATDGSANWGRCGDFSETDNAHVAVLDCNRFVNGGWVLEATDKNISFSSVHFGDYATSARGANCYFCSGDNSQFSFDIVQVDGKGSVGGLTDGTLVSAVGPVNATGGTVIDNTVNGVGIGSSGLALANINTFEIMNTIAGSGASPLAAGTYANPQQTTWTCTVNLSSATQQFCSGAVPYGLYRSVRVESTVGAADYTDFRAMYAGSAGNSADLHTSLVNGWTDLTSTLGAWGQNYLISSKGSLTNFTFTPAAGKSGTDVLTFIFSYWPVSNAPNVFPMAAINGGAVPSSVNCMGTDSSGKPLSTSCTLLYNTNGSQLTGAPHSVIGNCVLSAGTCTVTLSGSAIFTSISSYTVIGNDTTAAAAVKVSIVSGSSFTFTGTGTDTVSWIAVGN